MNVSFSLLGPILKQAFEPKPELPLHEWAAANVFLDRRITARPGFYDPSLFPFVWDFMEIARHRRIHETAEGVIVPGPGEGSTSSPVRQISVMKSSQSGFTEAALNLIRYSARHDPANTIFAIDSRSEAATINQIRLQPTLRRLGQQIFSKSVDDVSQFVLKLQRMVVYFLGSFSAGAIANKFAELVICDELEEHGQPTDDCSNVENLRARVKSAHRGLLIVLGKPKMSGGPIHAEYLKGSMHVPEVPCPKCRTWQQLTQENMVFSHCKDMLGQWELDRVQADTHFRCIHCQTAIEESTKKDWRFNLSCRRWRRTNPQAEPGHISFNVSDFVSFLPGAAWGKLAIEFISSKRDPRQRQGYRNNHEGLPWEIRATKTHAADILALRGAYKRGIIPFKPDAILLGADVGLEYVKWSTVAVRQMPGDQSEFAVIDFGKELSPDDLLSILSDKRYTCSEDGEQYAITRGACDAKFRRHEIHRVCGRSCGMLWPTAGIAADFAVRSISFNRLPPPAQPWLGVIVYVDRDAKHELYNERIAAWSEYLRSNDPAKMQPALPRLSFSEDLSERDEFLIEHTNEHLIEDPLAHSARQFIWKKTGPNHYGDATKVALVLWRFLVANTKPTSPPGDVGSAETKTQT